MSVGTGKPKNVPALGRQSYPKKPGKGARDGTGSFNSAARGGPALNR